MLVFYWVALTWEQAICLQGSSSFSVPTLQCIHSPSTSSTSSEHFSSSNNYPSHPQSSYTPYPPPLHIQIPSQTLQYNYKPYPTQDQQTNELDQILAMIQSLSPQGSFVLATCYLLSCHHIAESPQASTTSATSIQPRLRPSRLHQATFKDFDRFFKGLHQQLQRQCLDSILLSDWFINNEMEPVYGHRSVLCGLLSTPSTEDGVFRCLFDGCTKHFDRQDRAIGHIRVHLGHHPYACEGFCRIPNW